MDLPLAAASSSSRHRSPKVSGRITLSSRISPPPGWPRTATVVSAIRAVPAVRSTATSGLGIPVLPHSGGAEGVHRRALPVHRQVECLLSQVAVIEGDRRLGVAVAQLGDDLEELVAGE